VALGIALGVGLGVGEGVGLGKCCGVKLWIYKDRWGQVVDGIN